MVLQAMDRSRDVWVEGLRLFICNLHNLAIRDQRRSGALKMLNETLKIPGKMSSRHSMRSDTSRKGSKREGSKRGSKGSNASRMSREATPTRNLIFLIFTT